MSHSLAKTIKRLRVTLTALIASFVLALIITPVGATDGITELNKGALVVITLIGTLLFAIVFEVWRSTVNSRVKVKNRATHEWDGNKTNRKTR